MRENSFRQILLLILTVMIMLSGCQCGKPTEPDPIVKEYPIYFYNRSGEQLLFKYQPATQTMDSTIIQWDPHVITLSADGKLLYLAIPNSIIIIDAETYEFVRELPYHTGNKLAFSSDNKLIAITGDTLRILRTSDYQVIYSDTLFTYRGVFSQDNTMFYCAFSDSVNSGSAYLLHLTNSIFTVERKSFQNKRILHITPTHDQSKWILYNDIGSYCSSFDIYDVSTDSIIFSDILCPSEGTTALSPDGKKVYYTAPGNFFNGGGNPFFKVFDLEENLIDTVIDSFLLFSDGVTWGPSNPNHIIVIPNNKYFAILGGTITLSVFYLFDTDSLSLIDRRPYGSSGYGFTQMTVQGS